MRYLVKPYHWTQWVRAKIVRVAKAIHPDESVEVS